MLVNSPISDVKLNYKIEAKRQAKVKQSPLLCGIKFSHGARKSAVFGRGCGELMLQPYLARYGNRWILTAIITGMAPLVGLEAFGIFPSPSKTARFCDKTLKNTSKSGFYFLSNSYATTLRQDFRGQKTPQK